MNLDNIRISIKFKLFNRRVWTVPEYYNCEDGLNAESACFADKTVSCWVARPVEKTILIRGMLTMALISILLSILEAVYVSLKWGVYQKHKPKDQRRGLFMRKTQGMQ